MAYNIPYLEMSGEDPDVGQNPDSIARLGGIAHLAGDNFSMGAKDGRIALGIARATPIGHMGLYISVGPAAIRKIATQLNDICDAIEAEATAAATDALNRAKKGGA